jgi:hypothetical protein
MGQLKPVVRGVRAQNKHRGEHHLHVGGENIIWESGGQKELVGKRAIKNGPRCIGEPAIKQFSAMSL